MHRSAYLFNRTAEARIVSALPMWPEWRPDVALAREQVTVPVAEHEVRREAFEEAYGFNGYDVATVKDEMDPALAQNLQGGYHTGLAVMGITDHTDAHVCRSILVGLLTQPPKGHKKASE